MPITTGDLAHLSKVSLDDYIRNQTTDNISVQTPLLKKLMAKKKELIGGRLNVVKNIRKSHDSNFAWTYGEQKVSFNRRQTTELAAFPWKVAVDGMYIPFDFLFGNGIDVVEGKRGEAKLEKAERVQLIDLLDEQNSAFTIGFNEKLDLELHRSGTSSADAIVGLDALVSTTPETGTVGGIDRATASYWRNTAITGIQSTSDGELTKAMEKAWRQCHRNGGTPDFILAGSDFIDAYRSSVVVTQNAEAGKVKRIDAGVGEGVNTGLYFKGVEIIWDPQFENLDTLDSPDIAWEKRCYFLNMRDMELRDNDARITNPTRPHDTRCLFTMVELRSALTIGRSNAHAVLSIS